MSDVLRAYLEWTATVPDGMTSSVGLIPFPDAAPAPPPCRARPHRLHRGRRGGGAAGRSAARGGPAPARHPRRHAVHRLGVDLQRPAVAARLHRHNALPADLDSPAPLVVIAGPGAPMMCVVQLNHLGGALARPSAVPDAVEHRDARFLLRVISPLEGPDEAAVAAVHAELLEAVGRRRWAAPRASSSAASGERPSRWTGPTARRAAAPRRTGGPAARGPGRREEPGAGRGHHAPSTSISARIARTSTRSSGSAAAASARSCAADSCR